MVYRKTEGALKMLNKNSLREKFSKDYKRYYSTKLFENEGFVRNKCKLCGKYFWTADSARELCGDPSHEPYSFIKKNPNRVNYSGFWKQFSEFFRKNGHEIIESYPVVSRWRPDLYFVIAGIQDFQRIENGRIGFEYSANPLLVPQMCMRFSDIPNVGVSGRHFTSFMMANQTAFNYPKEGYWRDRTIELNFSALTKLLGIRKENLTYVEDVWAMGDFSEFGPCLESFSNGLEIVNSVFTQFEYSNGAVSELNGKVVDVGWGFERLLWFKSGEQTAYDSTFPNELKYLYSSSGFKPDKELYSRIAGVVGAIDVAEEHREGEEERLAERLGVSKSDYLEIIKPMQAMYAIPDHMRSLLFGVSDGALPSNVGGGYNLRVLLRRVFDFVERYNLSIDLMKVIEMEAKELKPIYRNIDDNIDEISEVIEIERKRYANTKSAARRIVVELLEKKEPPTKEKLKTLYESNGITPDFISAVAKERGVELNLPEDAYSGIITGDFVEARKKREREIGMNLSGIKPTKKLYYQFASSATAKVLKSESNMVVLDQTPFYPEGGGQEADHGTIDGEAVVDVKSADGVIVHFLRSTKRFKKGKHVKCEVNLDRRSRLMAHHTATHLVSAAARKVLGAHAWQEGAKKSEDKAHIDIAHYERLTDQQIKEIENTANDFILNGIKVSVKEMPRKSAEGKFGFSIYQGHGVPSGTLRIVEIDDLQGRLIDAEACGGLHLAGRESNIGLIKIISSYRIHDGIDRLEFVAGRAALDYISSMESSIKKIAQSVGTDVYKIGSGIEAKLSELSAIKDSYKRMQGELAQSLAQQISNSKETVIIMKLDYEQKMLRLIATKIVERNGEKSVLLYNSAGDAVAISGPESGRSALKLLNENVENIGGKDAKLKGGGTERIAEGRIA
ncbi:MAG: alanine--tRNA ligase [Candidatus Micrarchaeaceae archaeon]